MTNKLPVDTIRDAIKELLTEINGDIVGLEIAEVYRHLKGRISWLQRSDVQHAVSQLVQLRQLEERSNPHSGARLYHLPGHGLTQLFLDFETKNEIEMGQQAHLDLWLQDEDTRHRSTDSVMREIAKTHNNEDNFAYLVRNAAPKIAAENPIDLVLESAQWAVEDLNSLASRLRLAERIGNVEEVRRLSRQMGFRRQKIVTFFQRLWRLDEGILSVPSTVRHMMGGEIAYLNVEAARAILARRISGSRLVDIISVPANDHRAAVGTDASVGDLEVPRKSGSFIPPTPATLFVAAGAMRVIGNSPSDFLHSYWDFDIDPRELEQYEEDRAAEEGLLISPHLRREVISDFRHLRSAAMELRQYLQEIRVLTANARWHPYGNVPELTITPSISLLFRDGRIFPLVHRLDDYDGASAPDDVLYGRIVRKEITSFHTVFHNTCGHGRHGAIYAGAVKSPEFSWLAMLVFWYLHVKNGVAELSDGFYRPPLNDQAVSHLLFWGLAQENPRTLEAGTRYAFCTFKAIRRYSDIAFPGHPLLIRDNDRTVDEDSEDDWIRYIEAHIKDADYRHRRHERGVPSLGRVDDYYPFIDLCRRAAVAMYYSSPASMYRTTLRDGSHFLTPRWEICLDLSQSLKRQLEVNNLRLLSWITDKEGLVRDQSHAVSGFEEASNSLPLLIPDVVQRAHDAVGFTRDRHSRDVVEKLHYLINTLRDRLDD